MGDKTGSAKELLALEKAFQASGVLGEDQAQKWQELVEAIFADPSARRRSFRLPVEAVATVKIRQGALTCNVREVSRIGLSFTGNAFKFITHEDAVQLLKIQIGGRDVELDIKCNIMRVGREDGLPVVGVELSNDNSGSAREAFFARAYYPLYLSYLEHLAAQS